MSISIVGRHNNMIVIILRFIIRVRIRSDADDVDSISRTRTDRGEHKIIIIYKMIILYNKKSIILVQCLYKYI